MEQHHPIRPGRRIDDVLLPVPTPEQTAQMGQDIFQSRKLAIEHVFPGSMQIFLQYMFIYECFERIQEEQQWRHHIRLRDEQQQQTTDKGTCTSTVQPQQPQSDSTINNSASETFDKSNEEKNGEEIEEEENVNQSVSNGQAET